MVEVVGVRFKDSGKIYFFDPGSIEITQGEHVIVETVRGLELAKVVQGRRPLVDKELAGDLRTVLRRADESDFERMQLLHERHEEVLERCAEKVKLHGLPMSLVKAEYSFDGSRLTFYFTAEKRVDFRVLVRDLARTFRSRIELRQIGPRDEAKLLGGIGPCGRALCCATFLPDYARVSIKMAKDQDLPLNPAKISGVCGRLLCCLSYEHEQYIEMRAELPHRGAWVHTPDGPGEVVGQNVIKQEVTVQLASSGVYESYPLAQIDATGGQVSATARSRNAEGITPAAQHGNKRDQASDDQEAQRIIDAVAVLQDAEPQVPKIDQGSRQSGRRASEPQARREPGQASQPGRGQQQVTKGGANKRRRPNRSDNRPPKDPAARSAAPRKTDAPAAPQAPQAPQQAERSSSQRRRRRRGRSDDKPQE